MNWPSWASRNLRRTLVLGLVGVFALSGSFFAAAALLGGNDPDSPVSNSPGELPPSDPQPKLVKPQPGMTGMHPISWTQAELIDDRLVRVHFYSGVEPCYVLDHVDVQYHPAEIVIALFEGADPDAGNTACIEIAVLKAVNVTLDEPANGRAFVDGNLQKPDSPAPPEPSNPPPGPVRPTGPPSPAPVVPVPPGNSEPPVNDDPPGDFGQAKLVVPRPGMAGVHQVGWTRAEPQGERLIRVFFESGIEPCSVLDHVQVDYRPGEVIVTLFEGSDPAAKDQACIMIALSKVVEVALDQPLGGRQIVDGSEG